MSTIMCVPCLNFYFLNVFSLDYFEISHKRSFPFDMGEYISEGSHIITYTAIDEAGNQAKCDFHIVVRGMFHSIFNTHCR